MGGRLALYACLWYPLMVPPVVPLQVGRFADLYLKLRRTFLCHATMSCGKMELR